MCCVHSNRVILEFSTLSGVNPQLLRPRPNFLGKVIPGGGCAFDPQFQTRLQGLNKTDEKGSAFAL